MYGFKIFLKLGKSVEIQTVGVDTSLVEHTNVPATAPVHPKLDLFGEI